LITDELSCSEVVNLGAEKKQLPYQFRSLPQGIWPRNFKALARKSESSREMGQL
jgi:hypothetical protein